MYPPPSEWVTPPTRPDLIENLVSGVDRYNPSNVGILEDYLYHQIRTQEYDCLANLAILKLYQFNAQLYNPDVIINILVKALTNVPFPDFNLSIALLDARSPAAPLDEPDPFPTLLPHLVSLHNLLQQCRFPAFWALYRSDELESLRDNYTVEVVGFEDAIRDVAVRTVKATFQRIGKKRLGSYLDLEDADFDAYVEKLGWKTDESTGVVEVPSNPDNHISSTIVQEDIKLPQLSKIISHAMQAV
ncbi:initiation factor 3 [Vararia minispora EC-137]|uniref:Initiation factor 3 n=1 Tax=Vararia minispora EC-137 TaxID=1314806 RepID=A0ACB8QXZ9_9AGAM|nr:initiation factor 3 [Vararia minispora EC-137]